MRSAEKENEENQILIEELENNINSLRSKLNEVQEKMMLIRERKASSGATIDGLKKEKMIF